MPDRVTGIGYGSLEPVHVHGIRIDLEHIATVATLDGGDPLSDLRNRETYTSSVCAAVGGAAASHRPSMRLSRETTVPALKASFASKPRWRPVAIDIGSSRPTRSGPRSRISHVTFVSIR